MALPIQIATNTWVQTVHAKNTICFPEAREDSLLGPLGAPPVTCCHPIFQTVTEADD